MVWQKDIDVEKLNKITETTTRCKNVKILKSNESMAEDEISGSVLTQKNLWNIEKLI